MTNSIYKKSGFLFVSNFLLLVLGIFMLFSASTVHAMTPTLSLSGTGDGDTVQISVNGDPNSSVLLFYVKNGANGQQMSSLGTTNASGVFSTNVNTSTYGIVSGSSVYITTGGLNGSQSASMLWPASASMLSSSNMLSLDQTGLVLSLGQSVVVTASNLNSSSLYQSNNSNPQIANFNISGSQITVTGNSYGSTTGTFCLLSNTSNCGSIYVIVQSSSAQPLSFSQSSVSLSSGQTVAIQISGGSGSYSVINNSSQNNGTVQTNISGSTITLTTNSTSGSSSITVCSTSMTSCGIINVTIGNVNSTAVSFSQTNPTVTVAQSLNVSIFGPTNSLFYVASNSNPSIVQANLSGSTLSLMGITNGTSVLSICASVSNCGALNVKVNSDSSNNGPLLLSQYTVNLSVGQSASVTISGGAMPYNIINNDNSIVQSNLNSNVITLVGLSNGTSLMNACSTAGNCATLSINVGTSNNTLPFGCFSNTGYSLTTGVSCSSVSPQQTATTVPSDCNGPAFSVSTGQTCPPSTIITQSVIPPVTVTPPTTVVDNLSTTSTTGSTVFKFTKSLKLGSKGTEVVQLQKKLKTLGFYTGKADGGFGTATEKAVKAFQKAHKISQVGNVGPQTRALLNK